jgi:hypothetical protein
MAGVEESWVLAESATRSYASSSPPPVRRDLDRRPIIYLATGSNRTVIGTHRPLFSVSTRPTALLPQPSHPIWSHPSNRTGHRLF